MPNITLDGKTVNVDQNTAQSIKNLSEKPDLRELLDKFWTKEKAGRHPDLKKDHEDILLKTLRVDPEYLNNDLLNNKLKLRNLTAPVESILRNSKLSGDLSSNYIPLCMNVTSERPAIGKGEFLFVASFSNIGFSPDHGDLIDLDNKARIEVKGVSAVLGNSQNQRYKPMSEPLMRAVFRLLEIDDVAKQDHYLNPEVAKKIKEKIGLDRNKAKQIFTFLQNLRNENEALAASAVEVYFREKQLIRTVAAMHLYAYMKLEKNSFFLILNDKKFSIFESPKSLSDAYGIIDELSLKSWHQGEYGIKVTLR